MPRLSPSREAEIAAIVWAQAHRTAARATKTRAKALARRSIALDAIHPGLARASPATMIAMAERLLRNELRQPRRWFGFGGEVQALNAKAVLLLGRALRRAATR